MVIVAETTGSGWHRRRQTLLTEYERIALELFAERGFRNVTVDEIASAAGVSARTLFRYFPTKEDFLLTYTRRGLAAQVEVIAELEPSDTPLETAWAELARFISGGPFDVEMLNLWRRAAEDAPDVAARVRGERVQGLVDVLTDYCARSLGVDPAADVRPRLMAGMLAGGELALVETLTRTDKASEQVYADVIRSIHIVDAAAAKKRVARGRRRS